MANFNRENRSGRNRPDMHKATCSNCGIVCEVPFRPTGSKPVYCKECFRNNQGSDSQRSGNRPFNRPNSGDRQMYDAVCANCGNHCQVPFRPTQGKEVFCSNCFENVQRSESHSAQRRTFDKPRLRHDEPNYKAQFEMLNAKMDKILSLLTPTVTEIPPLESEIEEKVIDEIAQEVQKVKKENIKKEKKGKKSSVVEQPVQTKKASSSEKK